MEVKKKNRNVSDTQDTHEPVLKKHVGLIHCENKLTLIQRKICNILLYNALDKMNVQEIHSIPLKQLCSLVGYNSNDINLIKKSLKRLISVVMEWNLLEDNKFVKDSEVSAQSIAWHASSLLSGASIERGVISYSYSPQIKTVLSSLEIYGRINLFVQSKFNSSYSLVLYENCVRFKNIKQTSWFDLKLFRSLMGIEEKKYPSFKELKRNVITAAVTEINNKSDIVITPEYQKAGRQITAIKFLISENENYKPAFKRLTPPKENKARDATSLLDVLLDEFALVQNQAEKLVASYSAETLWEKIYWVRQQDNVRNKAAYLVSALSYNYTTTSAKSPKWVVRESESNYLRELKEASQISSLRKGYTEYKLNNYMKFLREQPETDQLQIQRDFEISIKTNLPLFNMYKKKEFQSPLVMMEFAKFIDTNCSHIIGQYLNFDDYLTAEQDEIVL